ncbi:aldo/keto reductase [Gemmobacter caeruleus]|uniref:aldo/keto reductase n=1 Tax=Gemmobacter caeruleus TaxID=2595004 RepID=UPI0011ED18DA|nr:aldo/keto reductase [Gemmobacter caeruleus]
MKQIPLGRSGLTVSEFCLGTMTWGTQNTEAEAHDQIALALDHGVNFWDTAELYPVNPVRVETAGRTEEIIGAWFAAQGGRDRVVLASKIAGDGEVRPGGITGASFTAALDASLRRLQTDYIDLYQLHWPNRDSYHFRENWSYVPKTDRQAVLDNMAEVLNAAETARAAGKIRALGLSNETDWGAAQWLRLADDLNLPRMATIQNEYSLLCRQFDTDWAELSAMEDMPLLAWSPLATGLLSGKYAGDVIPDHTRRSVNPTLGGRVTPQVFPAVSAYLGVAREHGLDPCQMALAFTRSRPWPCLPIIGATTLPQLASNIAAAGLVLGDEVQAALRAVWRDHPAPF